jgi:GTP-binding protein YchF
VEHLGLVGLADSGHDRLFAALTGLAVGGAAERTVGVVRLPDDRLDRLAAMSESQKVVPATFEIAYVPGLAPEPGKGLGSRLLGTLRDCDAILLVLRADGVDPADDLATIEYELVLADLASVEQRLAKQQRLAKGDKSLLPEIAALERAVAVLGDGVPVWRSDLTEAERVHLAPVFLLTNKPVLTVVDVPIDRIDETDALAAPLGAGALGCCTEIEGDPDVVAAEGPDRAALLADLGVEESVVPRLARAAYLMLGRRTFFTTGDKESRAWTFRSGARAPECAGVIHSDLQRGFIRAEVIHWDELLEIGGWSKAKDVGRLRVEGKEYEVADGDVLEIRFNV